MFSSVLKYFGIYNKNGKFVRNKICIDYDKYRND